MTEVLHGDMTRRDFIRCAAAASGAFVLAVEVTEAGAAASTFAPNAFIRVAADDTITMVMSLVEMGQGTYTAIPMLMAEELEVDLAKVRLEHAPANERLYGHPLFALQVTGGSMSIPGAWKALRQCAAVAKAMLVSAAAQTWNVPQAQCRAENGMVRHAGSGRTLSYGALARKAATLPVPKEAPLKDPSAFRLVGTRAPRTDSPAKVDGTARFGIDAQVQGMKVAAIANSPRFGSTIASVDDRKARAVHGVRTVLRTDTAVAVVADHYGAAKKGLAALEVVWRDGPAATFSSQAWSAQLAAALKERTGRVAFDEGSFEQVLKGAVARHDAVYEAPPLAHATMEPLNCTLHVRRDGCDVWLGTQAPARVQSLVAKATGLPPGRVAVHNHLVGGGFGRKLDADYVETAAKLARQVRYPLKVVFSREEDIRHDVYRPYFRDELTAALDARGTITGFGHRFAGSAVLARYAPVWLTNGLDGDAVHTAQSPYDIAARKVEFIADEPPAGLLTGNWRGVGPTHHTFVNEGFIDELAVLAKQDPLDYRRAMLTKNPRALAVLNTAAERAGWGAALPPRHGRGLAVVDAWGSYAALVTDIAVSPDGDIKVQRMVCAVDSGIAVNPDGVEAQMQGGLLFGLTAALHGRIDIDRGAVVQSNFHDYPMLRMAEAPKVEVHLVKSAEPPGGVGEIGTALVAPSLVNAVHAATGKRFRSYPVPPDQLRTA